MTRVLVWLLLKKVVMYWCGFMVDVVTQHQNYFGIPLQSEIVLGAPMKVFLDSLFGAGIVGS